MPTVVRSQVGFDFTRKLLLVKNIYEAAKKKFVSKEAVNLWSKP